MSPWSAISGYFVLTMWLSLLHDCRTDECRRAYVRSTQLIDRLGPSQPASCAAGLSPGLLDEGDQVVVGTTGDPRVRVAGPFGRSEQLLQGGTVLGGNRIGDPSAQCRVVGRPGNGQGVGAARERDGRDRQGAGSDGDQHLRCPRARGQPRQAT